LRQFTCILDYAHHRMFLKPNETFGEVFDCGPRSGLTFLATSEQPKPTVTFVIPDSPAAIAGIRAGDVIHELDHQPTRQLGVDRVERLLNRAGNSYQLVIHRGSRSLSIRLRV
jgi:C-terminal processing protease CtpA/Prc